MRTARPIGLYVHVPFCQHKCAYCDFYSVVTLEAMERYVEALCREIALRAEFGAANAEVVTVFWGGGTPSLLTPAQVEQIARALSDTFRFASDVEWTIEANPGTISMDKLRLYRQLGVNRLSFGVQSFDEHELRFLERIHTVTEAEEAINSARAAGFDNINLDIMYALPGQEPQRHKRNLERACRLGTDHISAYSLVYEPGTPLYTRRQRGQIIPLNDEQEAMLYAMTVAILEDHGFRQYEVSNFAREGKQCRHNLLYWHRGEYVGFGPSAHSHWENVRWSNVRNIHRYVEALKRGELPIAQKEQLSEQEQRTEYVFLGLRADGIELQSVVEWVGSDHAGDVLRLIEQWAYAGWATIEQGWIHLTSAGYAICDALTVELLDVLDRAHEAIFTHR